MSDEQKMVEANSTTCRVATNNTRPLSSKESVSGARYAPVRSLLSLPSQSYRNLNAVFRGIEWRVRRKIDGAQLRPVRGTNGLTECLFVAGRKAARRLQINTHAMSTDDPGGVLQSTVQFVRTGRLTDIETCGAHRERNRDFFRPNLGRTQEQGARRNSGDANVRCNMCADEGLGIGESGLGVHVDSGWVCDADAIETRRSQYEPCAAHVVSREMSTEST